MYSVNAQRRKIGEEKKNTNWERKNKKKRPQKYNRKYTKTQRKHKHNLLINDIKFFLYKRRVNEVKKI